MKSQYGVFIVENLHVQDYFDGKILHDILNLSKIKSKYRKVIDKNDFVAAIDEFYRSNLRYIHISCHADMNGIEINRDEITNFQLLKIFKNKIKKRRVFLSACKSGNRNIATAVQKCGGQSVIGTPIDLSFDKATLFWPAFYHVINSVDSSKMNNKSISDTLKKCVDLFEIPINYYHGINGEPHYLRRYKFRPNKKNVNNKIKLPILI